MNSPQIIIPKSFNIDSNHGDHILFIHESLDKDLSSHLPSYMLTCQNCDWIAILKVTDKFLNINRHKHESLFTHILERLLTRFKSKIPESCSEAQKLAILHNIMNS
jgi:hypothetical protein